MEKKQKWFIAIGHDWGVIEEDYTEKEAEEMRIHKAQWEGAPAIKITEENFLKLKDEEIEKNWAYKMIKKRIEFKKSNS